jgi:uncharacterized RDD family membrane protein YckC
MNTMPADMRHDVPIHTPRPVFWQRILAFLLDMIFLSAALIPLEVMHGTPTNAPLWPSTLAEIIILFAWFYLSWTSPMGGTLMMRWCGLHLRAADRTGPPQAGFLLLRWLVMFAPLLLALPLCGTPHLKLIALAWFPLLWLSCLFNRQRRGLHDLAGCCSVVSVEQYSIARPRWFDTERESIEARLARLKTLHATGVITDEEFTAQRCRVLDSI